MSQRKRLLIVDDDPDFVDGIRSILEAAGYEVDAAYNPKDGFEALQARPCDLLLLDIMMGRGAEGIMFARSGNRRTRPGATAIPPAPYARPSA